MGCFTISRAITVRILFTTHGVFSIWLLYVITENPQNWYLLMALFGLAFETAFTLYMKRGQDWKWFCPSVFFYLACLVPTIWFLELHELDSRIKKRSFNESAHHTTTAPVQPTTESEYELKPSAFDAQLYPDISGKLEGILTTTGFDSHQWVRTLEQLLLLILILGRWMLPKGKLTHDQLSQLLLVYIGTAADIVEFFEAFNEKQVMYDENLCTVILAIWSWSVLQFTLVFTATKARKEQAGAVSRGGVSPPPDSCCTPDVFGIIMSIFMQDGPFLVLRMLLIFRYNVVSYTNMFFTCKNTLVCMLLLYRLIVIQVERYKQLKEFQCEDTATMKENKRLLLSMHNSDQYYNYSTKVILRELLQQTDVNEKLITYVIKRHLSHASSLADQSNFFNDFNGSRWSPSDYSFNSSDDIRTFHENEYSIGPGDLEMLPIASYEVGSAGNSQSQTTSFTCSERQDSCVVELETGEYGPVEDLPMISSSQPIEDIVQLIFNTAESKVFFEETDSDSSLSAILRVRPPPSVAKVKPISQFEPSVSIDLSRIVEQRCERSAAIMTVTQTDTDVSDSKIENFETHPPPPVSATTTTTTTTTKLTDGIKRPIKTISEEVYQNDLLHAADQKITSAQEYGLPNNNHHLTVRNTNVLLSQTQPRLIKSKFKLFR